jgi:HAD superfamily hydrolase (TIGR01509 family)
LIDSREVHFESLNRALIKNRIKPISKEDHLAVYDGLPTKQKLALLTEAGFLHASLHNQIWSDKQAATLEIFDSLRPDYELIDVMRRLKAQDIKIACASNSVRQTVKLVLLRLGLLEFIDYWVSNEDVRRPKPYPEMYWACMAAFGVLPRDTIIVEDSHIGRQGALDSGATLVPVENRPDVTTALVEQILGAFPTTKNNIPWRNAKMNVLIPMAGAGSRFAQAGYTFPKPLIEVRGKPMIQVVIENLNIEANYYFIVQREHEEKYGISDMLNQIVPGCHVLLTDGMTEGAACTTLLARDYIDHDDRPLLIANSDQFVEWNSNETLYAFSADGIDAGIITFNASHPKWSYARLDENGFVAEVAEKRVISDLATVGIYYWKRGSDYVRYADQMIAKDIRVNGEFYVAPVFNEAIADGAKVRCKNVSKMWGIGTPEDLNAFLEDYRGTI